MTIKAINKYFDNAATTRLAPEVLDVMLEIMSSDELFANPSSATHHYGERASKLIDDMRALVAGELSCNTNEVVFTSGATEANNLAIKGIATAYADERRHIITSAIEHKSILDCCASLKLKGFDITYLEPTKGGTIDPISVEKALRSDTLLISLQYINNETGVIQPTTEVAKIAAENGILFHVDGAQAAGKYKINLREVPIDLLTLSAHKFYGPKGVGCLVVRDRQYLKMKPLMHGGGQEFGLRPGTLATHQIVGLGTALEFTGSRRESDKAHVSFLKHRFLELISLSLNIKVNGSLEYSSPYILNFSIEGITSDALMNQLKGALALSSGSACESGTVEPSYVLRAMGIEGEQLYGSVRLSLCSSHTLLDINYAAEQIIAAVKRMKELN